MNESKKREFHYLVGLGIEGYVLEKHVVTAPNRCEAYYAAFRYMHPDKGYTSITIIKRLRKDEVSKYRL